MTISARSNKGNKMSIKTAMLHAAERWAVKKVKIRNTCNAENLNISLKKRRSRTVVYNG